MGALAAYKVFSSCSSSLEGNKVNKYHPLCKQFDTVIREPLSFLLFLSVELVFAKMGVLPSWSAFVVKERWMAIESAIDQLLFYQDISALNLLNDFQNRNLVSLSRVAVYFCDRNNEMAGG